MEKRGNHSKSAAIVCNKKSQQRKKHSFFQQGLLMLIPEESPATIGDISDQTGPGLGSTGGLPSFRAGAPGDREILGHRQRNPI